MEILLIGNGFDLEHDLPTSYKNFLDFCMMVKHIYTLDINEKNYKKKYLDKWDMNNSIKARLFESFQNRKREMIPSEVGRYITKTTVEDKILTELYSYIEHNTWLEYFYTCSSNMGDNWIDLESEIARVIKALENAREKLISGDSIQSVESEDGKVLMTLLKAAKGNLKSSYRSVADIDSFTDFLNSELEKLIRTLEIYIAEFIDKMEVTKRSSDIEEIYPDKVLSFNYSNTYKRLYERYEGIEYSYIHGKADINKNVATCNLVLGIDEYLEKDEKDKKLEFLTFKKYYQRIYKSTSNDYLDWIDKIKDGYTEYLKLQNNMDEQLLASMKDGSFDKFPYEQKIPWRDPELIYPQHTLYIFGHSLDVTDKDVLKMLICNDNVQTKIYYYRKNEDDKKNLGKMIRNLVKIMGQEELIRRTGGTHRTIEFIPQTITK